MKTGSSRWLWPALAAFAVTGYAALIAPALIPSVPGAKALAVVPATLGWIALAAPMAMLIVVLYRAGADRYDGLWSLASIILLVAFAGEGLFRLSALLGFAPAMVLSTASPAGLVASLLWTGWASIDQKRAADSGADRPRAKPALRVATAVVAVAACVALGLYARPAATSGIYALSLCSAQALLIAGNALTTRDEPFQFMVPLLFFGLEYVVRALSATPVGMWSPRGLGFIFFTIAIVSLAAFQLSRKEARS
jgi:hypothetical protein